MLERVEEGDFRVVSSSHDQALAGQVFENQLLLTLVKRFAMEKNIDLLADPLSEQRLREAVEKAKIELSTTVQTNINLPYITADAKGPKVSVRSSMFHQFFFFLFFFLLLKDHLFCLFVVVLCLLAPQRRCDESHV